METTQHQKTYIALGSSVAPWQIIVNDKTEKIPASLASIFATASELGETIDAMDILAETMEEDSKILPFIPSIFLDNISRMTLKSDQLYVSMYEKRPKISIITVSG